MPAMRVTAQVSIFLLIGSVITPCANAFGPDGHLFVGSVAVRYLCADARNAVDDLLAGQSLGRAGQWADWIRSDPKWRHTLRWHYINVADGESVETVSGAESEDVLWAIRRFERELADESLPASERATALRFLAHFTADLHQPLHVGRAEDRGGNRIDVRAGRRNMNLHAFWDAQNLLKDERQASGLTQDQQIRALVVLTKDRVPELQADFPLDWARESFAFRALVYDFPAPESGAAVSLDSAYRAAAAEIVNARLSEAGVRLAGQLNRIFCVRPDTR